jgi:glycosyltransferase involved in cell wall biosynthesis
LPIRVFEVPPASGCSPARAQILRAASAAAAAFAPDILHLHGGQDFNALLPWLAYKRLRGQRLPTILQLHIWLSHSKRDPLHALSYRLIDQVWCSSEPARRSALKILPIGPEKARVLRYGRPMAEMEANMLAREAARAELGLPADAVVVGSVSRIDRGKGTAELIEGTVRAMRAHPRLFLALIGGPTEDSPREAAFAEELKRKAEALPQDLRARVRLLGPLPQSHRLLKAFDLFALPTYRECFSLALMEAQLAALPCIATNAGGSPELVREGLTGWLCQPESTDSFAEALNRALADQPSWAEYGERARARARAEYDRVPALDETITAYRDLLGS